MSKGFVYLTRERLIELEKELQELKTNGRKEIASKIAEARSHGDLSENAEFAAAKDRQSFLQGRIAELEYKLANTDIIDTRNLSREKVVFGSRVVLENVETGEDVEYQLVGSDESNVEAGRISISSPLGSAIIGKKPGDELTIQVPGGSRTYELVDIL